MVLGPVATLILAFATISLVAKLAREKIELFLHSNYKYRLLNSLAPYIYYGSDVGVEASLRLDSPTDDVLRRRLEGQEYLSSRLNAKEAKDGTGKEQTYHGPALASSLADCRFALAKVCMPLLRELEFPAAGRNFISDVLLRRVDIPARGPANGGSNGRYTPIASNRSVASASDGEDAVAGGILTAVTEDGVARPYIGNDAIHSMGVESFYAPIQKEINRRMELDDKENEEAMLRFCPIAMNSVLERNVALVKKLTGMDTVS